MLIPKAKVKVNVDQWGFREVIITNNELLACLKEEEKKYVTEANSSGCNLLYPSKTLNTY